MKSIAYDSVIVVFSHNIFVYFTLRKHRKLNLYFNKNVCLGWKLETIQGFFKEFCAKFVQKMQCKA